MTGQRDVRNVVIYARKSMKSDRGEEQSASVETQIAQCEAYAAKRGWTVVGRFFDDGKSGLLDRTGRPYLDRALRMLESREAESIVMLWKSRLSRDELDRVSMVRDFEKLGVEWHAVADGGLVDRTSYAGYLKDGVDALFDSAHSVRVRENFKRIHSERLAAGLPKTGNARFGYTRDKRYDPRTDRYFPSGPFFLDPVTGPVLRELYRRYTAGAGFTPLVKWLNDEGHTTTAGQPWSVRSLGRMLDSGFGAGLISREDEHRERKGSHETVINADEWDAYVRARKRAATTPRKAQAPRWWLAGIVKCGLCSGPTYINSFESKTSSVECSRHRSNPDACSGRMRAPRRWVENQVHLWFSDHFDELAAQIPARESAAKNAQSAVDAARTALADTSTAFAKVTARWARGRMDDATYETVQKQFEDDRLEQEKTLTEAQDQLTSVGPVAMDALAHIGAFEGTPAEFGHLVGKVLERVEIHPDKLVFVPVTGDAETLARPNLRALAARRREAINAELRRSESATR